MLGVAMLKRYADDTMHRRTDLPYCIELVIDDL